MRMLSLRLLLCFLAVVMLTSACDDGPRLRIAAWNLEHLNDSGAEGCVPRTPADYDAMAAQVRAHALDIVAFQEVENETAAHRVFPEADWHVEMSSRPDTGAGRECWDRPDHHLAHLATGFAIRRGIAYRRNADLEALGEASAFQRWGTGVTVTAGGQNLRLLSVHLASGCWGSGQDADPGREDICAVLRGQMSQLKAWADARQARGRRSSSWAISTGGWRCPTTGPGNACRRRPRRFNSPPLT